jgi:hypothetical protein
MSTTNLLSALHEYLFLLMEISKKVRVDNDSQLLTSVSLSYERIRLTIEKVKRTTGNARPLPVPYLQYAFQINGNEVSLTETCCEQREHEDMFRELILQHRPDGGYRWNTKMKDTVYSQEAMHYVAIADSIASEVYFLDTGDDYRPGYFTEISARPDQITLRQINRHNARSIDHKTDYFMRELEFFIPLLPVSEQLSFDEEMIGKMRVHFEDHSSKQNKTGGDRIREKINEERLKFNAPSMPNNQ